MGLTWIDYETIDKPIEEITQGTGEADEIEFHIETLSNAKEAAKYYGGSNNLGKPSKKDSLGGIKVFLNIFRYRYHAGGKRKVYNIKSQGRDQYSDLMSSMFTALLHSLA